MSTRKKPALITAAILAGLAVACGSGSSASKTPTPQPGIPGQDPQAVKDVQTAFQNLAKIKTLRIDFAAETRNATTGAVGAAHFVYEFVPPDRYQLISTTGSVTRVVGSETFSGTADGVWSKDPFSGPQYEGANNLFEPKFLNAASAQIGVSAKVVKGATDKVNDTSCQGYVMTDLPTGNTTDVCIASGYPAKMAFHSGGLTTTAVILDINKPIQIERPPIP